MSSFQTKQVRTRFAPSPTGYLHVGGARTALFNYLFAKQNQGTFVLRVEDTDEVRNTKEAKQAIFSGLEWLGLVWDEGPNKGGEHGPYWQSERSPLYETYFNQLLEKGRVYEDEGAYRFKFERKMMVIQDLVCGKVEVDYRDESINPDMVIRRSDGSFTFHFVNVIDDLEMEISHVIRGEDHLMNTPKHLQLFEALEKPSPEYAHLPLILNMDGSKMSKRDQGAAVGEYQSTGYLPEAVVNFLALLGWSSKVEQEIFSLAELTEKFLLSSVNRAPAKFDLEKCTWMNQQHIGGQDSKTFAEMVKPLMSQDLDARFEGMVSSIQQKVKLLTEAPPMLQFFFDETVQFDEVVVEKVKKNASAATIMKKLSEAFTEVTDWSDSKEAIQRVAQELELKAGKLMFPLRVALTGASGGPDLGDILLILGKEESIKRVKQAAKVFD